MISSEGNQPYTVQSPRQAAQALAGARAKRTNYLPRDQMPLFAAKCPCLANLKAGLKLRADGTDTYITERCRRANFWPATRCSKMGSVARNRTLAFRRVLPVLAYSGIANNSRFNSDCPLRSARIH